MPVLIVDDNVDVCEFLTFIVSAMGHQVHGFTEPESVISFIKEQHIQPAFLIADYNLPYMTGYELHKQIHALTPAVKTIIISGRSVQGRIGSLPFLQKPFSAAQITNLIETLQAS